MLEGRCGVRLRDFSWCRRRGRVFCHVDHEFTEIAGAAADGFNAHQAGLPGYAIAGLWQFVQDSRLGLQRDSCLQARARSTLRIQHPFNAGLAGPTCQAVTSP